MSLTRALPRVTASASAARTFAVAARSKHTLPDLPYAYDVSSERAGDCRGAC
jgi:hypothetical protein